MTLGFESPLPFIFARLFAQSGTAAAAWSGMWYGLAIGAMNAATRSTAERHCPGAGEARRSPPCRRSTPVAAVALVRSAKPAGRKGGSSRR